MKLSNVTDKCNGYKLYAYNYSIIKFLLEIMMKEKYNKN